MQSDAEPVAWQQALEQHLFDLIKLARDKQSGERAAVMEWAHPCSALVNEFCKRIAALSRPDASAGLIEMAEWLEANNTKWGASWSPVVMSVAEVIRARATDRNAK